MIVQSIILTQGTFFVLGIILLWLQRKNPAMLFQGTNKCLVSKSFFIRLLATPIIVFFVGIISNLILLIFGIEPQDQEINGYFNSDFKTLIPIITSILVLAPICEEFFFRGVLYRLFERFSGKHIASVCVAAIFAAIHLNISAFVPLFVFSLILTATAEKYKTLSPLIVMHAFFNAISLTFNILMDKI